MKAPAPCFSQTARRCRFAALAALVCLSAGQVAVAAEGAKEASIDPREFGLEIPRGKLIAGDGRRAEWRDRAGAATVAKIHVEVGDQRVLLLPDGTLQAAPAADAPDTPRAFEPLKPEELAARLKAGPLAGFETKISKRHVFVYNTSENFALVTSRILETMFPGIVAYARQQRLEVSEPETPLAVVMFRTEEEFQRYQKMPAGVVAYYNVVSNQVVMYEELKISRVKPELAIQQSISTIAHEGVHQVLHNIGVQQRLSVWPMWLGEGVAEYFAPTSVGNNLKWKGAGQINDVRMAELEQYLQSRAAEAPGGEMVGQTVLAARLTSAGYASAWALTHYLAKNQRMEFHRYLQEASRLGPLEGNYNVLGPGVIPENLAQFKKHFGDDLGELERRLVLYLKKQPYSDPFADWPTYAALLATTTGRKPKREVRLFHSQSLADRWLKESIDALPEEQRGAAQGVSREFPNRAAADLFARQWLQGK